MARPRERVRLEDGLKLDLNKLIREGFWPRDGEPLIFSTQWTWNRRVKASAGIVIEKHGEDRASLGILIADKFEQWLDLIARPRHFGGHQWYFRCPVTGRKCSMLPPGANRFRSRQAWGKQVAYSTEFQSPFDRALSAREKVKARLIGNLNPQEWDLPPKPKWMRWLTYERLAQKYNFHHNKAEQMLADYVG